MAIWTFAAQVMGKRRARSHYFDSRPLKVRNQPLHDVWWQCATWRWNALEESYNFGSNLVPIRTRGEKLWMPKIPGVQTRTISGLHLGSPGKKSHLGVAPRGAAKNTIRGKVVASPESGPWWVKWVQVSPWLVPTPSACRMTSNQLVLVLDAGSWPNNLISS